MNPHRLLNEVGANYSAYRTRNFVGVPTRHLIEHNKYASWTLLLGLWAPDVTECTMFHVHTYGFCSAKYCDETNPFCSGPFHKIMYLSQPSLNSNKLYILLTHTTPLFYEKMYSNQSIQLKMKLLFYYL